MSRQKASSIKKFLRIFCLQIQQGYHPQNVNLDSSLFRFSSYSYWRVSTKGQPMSNLHPSLCQISIHIRLIHKEFIVRLKLLCQESSVQSLEKSTFAWGYSYVRTQIQFLVQQKVSVVGLKKLGYLGSTDNEAINWIWRIWQKDTISFQQSIKWHNFSSNSFFFFRFTSIIAVESDRWRR